MVNYYWNNVFGSKQSSLSDFSVLIYVILLLSHPAVFKQLILSQYWPNIIPIIGSILVAGRLPIHVCCTNIIPLLGADMKPMPILPMETQYWANVAWQDNANFNIANGKPTLGQYIYVVWDVLWTWPWGSVLQPLPIASLYPIGLPLFFLPSIGPSYGSPLSIDAKKVSSVFVWRRGVRGIFFSGGKVIFPDFSPAWNAFSR